MRVDRMEDEMIEKKMTNELTTTTTQLTDTDLVAIRQSGLSATGTVIQEANALVIIDADTYQAADLVLFKIRSARKTVEALIEQEITSIIKPIRKGLDRLYAIQRTMIVDLDTPLETAEKTAKRKMAAFQDEERRRAEEVARKKREEEARLERERQDAVRRQQEAEERAAQLKGAAGRRAAAEAEEARQRQAQIEQERQQVSAAPVAVPIRGAGSRVTLVKTWEITDMILFIAGVLSGEIPETVLQVDKKVMDAYWDTDRGVVLSWSGVGMKEETRVGGR